MEASGNGNSNNEDGSHYTKDKTNSPNSTSSQRLVNSTNDDDNKSQTASGEVNADMEDTPSVKSIDDQQAYNQDVQDGTEGGKIYEPRKYDVLLGRGRPLQDHPGNLRFHKIVNRARASYLKSRKEGKAGIAREVMYEIKTSKNPESKSNQSPTNGHGDGGGDEVNSPSSGGEPGRFLKKAGDFNGKGEDVYWMEVSHEVAIEKISHALRGRPRSETTNRSDGSGGSKGSRSGGEKGQSSRRHSKDYESSYTGGAPKRKGPPSPPTNETGPVAEGNAGVGARMESCEASARQTPNITDAMFSTHVNTPARIPISSNTTESTTTQPLYNAADGQVQSLLTALQLQQYQAAMQLQHQNSQQVAQLQLIQQLMQQQHVGVGAPGTAAAFGQGTGVAGQLTTAAAFGQGTGVAGQLTTHQQQLQLLLQQQQAQHLLQQQQLQPQQLQYLLQQSQLQPQQSQQQQQQVQSTTQSPQQPYQQQNPANPVASNATASGTATDPNFITLANAMLSAIQQTTGNSSVNPAVNTQNILSAASSILAGQQSQGAPNPIAPNPQQMVPTIGGQGPQVQVQIQQQQLQQQQTQIQQQLQHIMQQYQALFAVFHPQQHPSSTPNSSSSAAPQPPGNLPPSSNPPS